MSVPSFGVRLTSKGVETVVGDFDKVEKKARKTSKAVKDDFSKDMSSALGSVKTFVAGLGVAFSVGAFVAFVKNAKDVVDATADMAQGLGTTVERLTSLQAVARTAGGNNELVSKSLVKMGRSVDEFAQGLPAASKAFSDLGVKLEDLNGKDVVEQFAIISQAFQRTEDPTKRLNASISIFGRGVAALLPTLNSVGEIGFGGMIEKARTLAQVIRDDDVTAIQSLNDKLDDAKTSLDVVGAAFVAGFAPGFEKAIDDAAVGFDKSSDLGRKIGGMAGEFFNETVIMLANIGDALVTVSQLVIKTIETMFEQGKVSIKSGMNVLKALWDDRFEDALQNHLNNKTALPNVAAALKKGDEEQLAIRKRLEKEVEDLLNGMQARLEERKAPDSVFIGPLPAPEAYLAKQADLLARGEQQRLDAVEKGAKDEAETREKVRASAELADRAAYDRGEISLADYHARRRARIEAAAKDELALLGPQRAALQNQAQTPARDASLNALAEKEKQVREKRKSDLAADRATELQADLVLKDKRVAFEAEVAKSRGDSHLAEIMQIKQRGEAYALLLHQLGVGQEEIERLVAEQQRTLLGGADIKKAVDEAKRAIADVQAERDRINDAQGRGLIMQSTAEEKILELERDRTPAIRDALQATLLLAQAQGDQSMVDDVQRLIDSLRDITPAANRAHASLAQVADTAQQTAIDSLTNSLGETIDQFGDVGDAARQMALDVVKALRRMAAEALAADLVKAGSKGLKSIGNSIGNAVIGTLGAADGGLIRGPGTETSDSIRARLSNNEFVVRAWAVKQPGILGLLSAVNKLGAGALRAPTVQSVRPLLPREPAFADGGLVVAPAQSNSEAGGGAPGELKVGLDRGLFVEFFRSPEGQRVLVEGYGHNRRAMNALGQRR